MSIRAISQSIDTFELVMSRRGIWRCNNWDRGGIVHGIRLASDWSKAWYDAWSDVTGVEAWSGVAGSCASEEATDSFGEASDA